MIPETVDLTPNIRSFRPTSDNALLDEIVNSDTVLNAVVESGRCRLTQLKDLYRAGWHRLD